MSVAEDHTPVQPICVGLGIHDKREEAAPVTKKRTASEMIEAVVSEVMEIARTPDPSETQAQMLQEDLKTLTTYAQRGVAAGQALAAGGNDQVPAGGSGGGRGGRILTLVASVVIAGLTTFGVNGLSVSDDAAQARVMAEQHESRIGAVERAQQAREEKALEDERRARRIQGLTVRWLGDTQEKECKALGELVKGINRLAPRRSKSDPIEIDCQASTLPPELVQLEAALDIAEGARQ